MSQQYDFVAIGDILIDAFIQLNKDQADVSALIWTGRKTFANALRQQAAVRQRRGSASRRQLTKRCSIGTPTLALRPHSSPTFGHDKFGKECIDALRQERDSPTL